ncbi:MAG: ATP-binding protein [Thermodesulfobacteriota bacterium]|nr:ATP-binding protein [Thermodesulfobacteriota bacterium]
MSKGKDTKLYLHLKKWLEKAALDYSMLQEGDRVLVGVSGGLDSLVLLNLLNTPMLFLPRFSLLAVNIDLGFDKGYSGYAQLEHYLKNSGHKYIMEKTDIGSLAHSDCNKKNPCFLCSRMRRKRIFEIANENGCNKIAFAHHKDDIIETLLINMFYGREISTMMPDQSIFGGKFHLIRPLAYVSEPLIKKYAREKDMPVIENGCPTSKTSRRMYIKRLLDDMEKDNKDVRENIFKSMNHVKIDYLPGHDMNNCSLCGTINSVK